MPKNPKNGDAPLSIPSFLMNPKMTAPIEERTATPRSSSELTMPEEEEVDAVMESVLQAASLPANDEAEKSEVPSGDAATAATAAAPTEPAEPAPKESLATAPEEKTMDTAEPSDVAKPTTESESVATAKPTEGPAGDQMLVWGFDPKTPEAPEDSDETPQEEPTEAEATTEPGPEPTLEEDLRALDKIERRIFAHRYAATELEAFGTTIDPLNATADRAEALAVLMEEDHELLGDPAVGTMLERLTSRSDELEPMVAAQVRVLSRDRHRLVSVSAADQAKLVRLTSEAYDVWLRAKAENNWRSFAPYLDRLVSLKRKIAKTQNPDADPYDTLLDEHEHGTNRAFYNSFFARVKRCVIPLLSSISMSGRTLSRACIEGRFDEARQWELARDVARLEGINEDAHYLTSTEHPFSEAMTSNYAVTAAHVQADDLMSNVYTMLHEVGHNLYEQGVNPDFNRTSLKGGTSMGMHEAQLRFFENYVGRDRAFVGPLLALLKKRFPGQLSRVTPNQLYLAVNRVAPSYIRTEADELTYPLHIIVRYEIEQLLMAGEATAREVPRLWADRYRDYIGADVPNDTLGALQDVHWSQGEFGYFPTYALGNAYAAQLRAKMIEEGMDWQRLLAAGDLAPIREWLRERVWRHGRSMDPADIIKEATGEPFNPRHYANYLTGKFTALYNVR